MKGVLLIGNYPPPYGGVPSHIEFLAPFLVRKGWDVHVLSGGNTGVERKDGFTVYKPDKGTKFISALASVIKPFRTSFDFRAAAISRRELLRYAVFISIARKIIEKNSIKVISAYNLCNYAPIGAALSEEYGIPLVVTNFGEIFSNNAFCGKNVGLIDYIARVSKRLLAMSRHCGESYRLLGLSPNVEVIPYGVDTACFSPANDGAGVRKRLGLTPDERVVAYVGRLTAEMGAHTMLDAIELTEREDPEMKFLIIGEKGEMFERVQAFAKGRANVILAPRVPFSELPQYYAAASIIAAPTQGERACGSLASIEGMATGKPVIASNVGGIPEIVEDGATGLLIPPEDPQALKAAILKLFKDPSAMSRMGAAGRQRVEERFDNSRMGSKIERLLQEVSHP